MAEIWTCEVCNVQTNFVVHGWKSPKVPEYRCLTCTSEKVEVRDQVYRHNKRTANLGLPATLTREQWMKTRWHFQHKCVYCGWECDPYGGAIYLDHFIPVCYGGGTTYDNCVPTCCDCNRRKSSTHPDDLDWVPQDVLDRIRAYLADTAQR